MQVETGPESTSMFRTRSAAVRQERYILLAPLLILVAVWPFIRQTDPDYWWHCRTGQLIWQSRALPQGDPFSYTAAGAPWTMHEWLSETLMYLVESRVGYWANAALFGLMGAGTALLIYLTSRLWGLGELPGAILMLWGFTLMAGSHNVRPQAFTAVLVAAEAYLLTRYKTGNRRAIWALPALYALWVNVHGGYVIGLALLGLAVVGEWLAARRGQPAAPIRPLLVATALAVGATLVNPYGVRALLYPLGYAGTGNASMRYIQEWQSPDFHQAGFVTLAVGLAALMAVGVGRRPLGMTETLWALLTAMMSLLSVRHIQLFGIVAMPLLGARAQAEVPALRRTLAAWRRPGLLAVLWPVVAVALLAGIVRQGPEEASLQFGRAPSAVGYPSGAVAYLQEHHPTGNLLNHYGWGGYLIYSLYPGTPVFIDGRADVYGDAHMDRAMTLERLRPGWDEILEQYDVGLVLMPSESPLVTVLERDRGWATLYTGEIETLLRRTSELAGR